MPPSPERTCEFRTALHGLGSGLRLGVDGLGAVGAWIHRVLARHGPPTALDPVASGREIRPRCDPPPPGAPRCHRPDGPPARVPPPGTFPSNLPPLGETAVGPFPLEELAVMASGVGPSEQHLRPPPARGRGSCSNSGRWSGGRGAGRRRRGGAGEGSSSGDHRRPEADPEGRLPRQSASAWSASSSGWRGRVWRDFPLASWKLPPGTSDPAGPQPVPGRGSEP